MLSRSFQQARDFAGADWESMKPESRKALLTGYNVPPVFSERNWWQLPPTVKQALALTLMKKRTVRK